MKAAVFSATFAFVSGCLGFLCYAQAPRPLVFETASVKPADPNAKRSGIQVRNGNDLNVENRPVRNLIKLAWSVQDFQLAGRPGWLATDRFDISAKAPRDESIVHWPTDPHDITDELLNARSEHLKVRLRSLLTERFDLAVHHESRETTVYLLGVSKSGSKMKEITTPGDKQGLADNGKGKLQGYAATMSQLAHALATALEQPVEERTGLNGTYDFALEWTPDSLMTEDRSTSAAIGPTVFSALQNQLGLKLESSKGSADFLVIDRIKRPSEN
jgi:uncharacterized protein (TIGR03435 family)